MGLGAGEVLSISAGKISVAEDAEGARTSCGIPSCKLSVTKKLDGNIVESSGICEKGLVSLGRL